MTTWNDKAYTFIPAQTDIVEGNIFYRTVFDPNVIVDSSAISEAMSEKSSLSFSGKGRVASVDIRHQEDTPHTLLGIAFIFKLKKP